jgi:hypothetical protein
VSQKASFTNSFSEGVVQDMDKVMQKPNTMRDANNISLIFNRDQETDDGVSMSVAPIRGNKFAFTLCDGYVYVGDVETKYGAIIFSYNGLNSEIGEVSSTINGLANYITLFNDKNDPNGDLLRFGYENTITGTYVYENTEIERIYFTQEGNQKRCINLKLLKTTTGVVHQQGCSVRTTYPKYMSVHAMDTRMDLVYPILKFKQRIEGQLKSGTYQLFVRYVSKDGHKSVVSPETNRVFVTDAVLDKSISGDANAYKVNHHNRYMSESNVMTSEGIRWTIKDIDKRWDFIEVGYIYHTSDLGFQEANVFRKIEILNQTSIDVDLLRHSGYPITRGKINERFETLLSVGSTFEHEGRIFDADIELVPEIELRDAITIRPITRNYVPDTKGIVAFNAAANKVSQRDDGDPITNTATQTTTINISRFTGVTENYDVLDDFNNYKGQQFESVLQGNFRGETYPYAIVPFDRKGNPMYSEHIQDFTFPDQFDAGYTLTEEVGAQTNIKILGAMFDKIRLPASKIRDKYGKLNISGFAIVRADRVKRILHQGVIFPCVETENCSSRTKNDIIVKPLPTEVNRFEIDYGNINNLVDGPMSTDAHQYTGGYVFCGKEKKKENATSTTSYTSPYMATYHSPDVLIEGVLKEAEESDFLRHIGQVHAKFTPRMNVQGPTTMHRYNKCYLTDILTNTDEGAKKKKGRPTIGQTSRIKYSFLHNKGPENLYEDTDIDFPEKDFMPLVGIEFGWCNKSVENYASLQPNAAVFKMKDFESVDISRDNANTSSYRLVNYVVKPQGYYTETGDSSLETRSYYSTGHFQPITEAILSQVPQVQGVDGLSYEFNDVEVWGGDCYVTMFDFTRMYPLYSEQCDKVCQGFLNLKPGGFPDYAVSHIVPIESKYNLMLLYGRRFAANATNPQATGCDNLFQNLSNGIMFQQPEDWAYNKVLNTRHSTRFYPTKLKDTLTITKKDSSFYWSAKKTNGEIEDSFRKNYVGDTGDVVGKYGKITGFVKAFNYIYVIQESGYGTMLLNSREFLSTDASNVVISTGAVYSGVNYISKEVGSQHKNSIWQGPGNAFGFVDARMGGIIRFAQNGNVELNESGFDDLITSITIPQDAVSHTGTFRDIVSGYDYENKQLFVTFHGGNSSKTIGYNDNLTAYMGTYDFFPAQYFKIKRNLFSQAVNSNQVYVHGRGRYGEFYGIVFETWFKFIVNPELKVDKFFDNGVLYSTNGEQRIRRILHESYEATHDILFKETSGVVINSVPNGSDYKRGNIYYAMHEKDPLNQKGRLCGKFLEITVFIGNFHSVFDGNDTLVSIPAFETVFRAINQ